MLVIQWCSSWTLCSPSCLVYIWILHPLTEAWHFCTLDRRRVFFVSAGQQWKQHEPFCCWFKCIPSLLSNTLIVSYSCNYDILVLHQAKTQPCFHGPRGNLNHSFTHLCYVGGERGEELDFFVIFHWILMMSVEDVCGSFVLINLGIVLPYCFVSHGLRKGLRCICVLAIKRLDDIIHATQCTTLNKAFLKSNVLCFTRTLAH